MLGISFSGKIGAGVIACTVVEQELFSVFKELEGADVVMVVALVIMSRLRRDADEVLRGGYIPFCIRENVGAVFCISCGRVIGNRPYERA
jgi:hypothetical protein